MNDESRSSEEIRAEILRLTAEYSRRTHQQNLPADQRPEDSFVAGKSHVPYAGRVFDSNEVTAAVGSTLDFWLTLGKHGEEFERRLAERLGIRKTILVNSGSSANLLAVAALTSEKLGARQIKPGDEIITVAAGFPTTVTPMIQNGLVPVFIDNDPRNLNARVDQLEEAFSPGKTKAVMMAHTLGNPFDLATVTAFCKKHDLWLVEDNCDALGSTYNGQMSGTFGDLSTQSFYPPHHLTLGEGGAVNIINETRLKPLVESFRDWGRDCWCPSGKDNTCNKRFCWQLGELPESYDHKFIYSHFGYNLKPLDIQAAIGVEQLQKLDAFSEARRANWQYMRQALAEFEEFLEFQLPTHATAWTKDGFEWDDSGNQTDPCWFGFMIKVRQSAPFGRADLARAFDEANIGQRMLFGGNLTKQPAFVSFRKSNPDGMRIVTDCVGADDIMNNALFIGVFPGLTKSMLDYVIEVVSGFVRTATAESSTVASSK